MRAAMRSQTSDAAAGILRAIRAGDSGRLERELDRAAGVCAGPWRDSDAEERAELLEAVLDAIRLRQAEGAGPRAFQAHLALLGHLAGST
jgi:hypothetical protein